MRHAPPLRSAPLLAFALPLALALVFSGCTMLGLGAAAGATVGGCALLDRDDDAVVTQDELSAGLYDAWDTNRDDRLTEAEFEAGVGTHETFAGWSGTHAAWDADDDATLTRAEFSSGVASRSETADWADARCDDLGL